MALSEQDEFDLIGLATGAGTPESDLRAQRLLDSDPLAVEYIRQIVALRDTLKDVPEPDVAPLPDADAALLAEQLLKKAEGRRAAGPGHRRRWIGILAAAASLAILTGGWFAAQRLLHPVVARAVRIPPGGALSAFGQHVQTKFAVHPDDLVSAEAGPVLLRFDSGNVALLTYPAQAALVGRAGTIDLKSGLIYVKTRAPLQVRTELATIECTQSELVISVSSGHLSIATHSGTAQVHAQGRAHTLTAGDMAGISPPEQPNFGITRGIPLPPLSRMKELIDLAMEW